MPSSFGWLDTDDAQRRKMLEVVDLFKEESTVDELGIASIRDALANSLFPGTSYVQTRLRYVLFVPWLMQLAAAKPASAQMVTEFRTLEIQLIASLLKGGESVGVIGNTARGRLQRMPSGMYWTAIRTWGILRADVSSEGFFRRQYDLARLERRIERSGDGDAEAGDTLPGSGLDRHLPPRPNDLLRAVTFAVPVDESAYLCDVIAESTRGSMLSWLVQHPPAREADYVWHIDNLDDAPERLVELIDHARRFHTAIHGANLVYNLVLARKGGRDARVNEYEDRLRDWAGELASTAALEGWDRVAWWAALRQQNPRLRPATTRFFDSWLDLITNDSDLVDNSAAHRLVSNRERQIKGGRARVVNQSALDRWGGGTGLGRHDFRWTVARRHLADLFESRKPS